VSIPRTTPWPALGVLVAFAVACASPGIPPGGPPDAEVPQIVRITPESNAVNVRASAILVHFDEVISERPGAAGGGGVPGLDGLVMLSPSDGRDQVNWRRTAIEIKPRRGFRPNTAYRVTILPGVADLRGNVVTEPTEIVFSTGPVIPSGAVRGVLFDWAAGAPAARARVELSTPADSTFRWSAQADSSGRFLVRDLAPGNYRVRAWIDANSDRRLGLGEASDTALVSLTDSASLELYAYVRDTLAPRLENVEAIDSTALRVRFDRVIAGDWDASGAVTIFDADSAIVPLGGTLMPSVRRDSIIKATLAAQDSAAREVARAADTAVVADTVAPRAPGTPPGRGVPAPPAALDSAALADSIAAAADSLALPPPEFRRVRPHQVWAVSLDSALAPGTYRLRVIGAPGLNGRSQETEREFRVREPPPPVVPDSIAPPDSTIAPVQRPRQEP
jgi:hypothetical protein